MTNTTIPTGAPPGRRSAHLDEAHVGDIEGAFGPIKLADPDGRTTWWRRVLVFLAIVGPGLIVMVGDNDAGAFGTYTQAAQMYGTALLWTPLLLVPVLYVNQEMALRLRAGRADWRMPSSSELSPAAMSKGRRLWMSVLRGPNCRSAPACWPPTSSRRLRLAVGGERTACLRNGAEAGAT